MILGLVKKYHEQNCQDKELIANIQSSINASPDLRDKKELILNFINKVSPEKGEIEDQWLSYISQEKENELQAIIAREGLEEKPTRAFIDKALQEGHFSGIGTAIKDIMPNIALFGKAKNLRAQTKERIMEALKALFNRYYNII